MLNSLGILVTNVYFLRLVPIITEANERSKNHCLTNRVNHKIQASHLFWYVSISKIVSLT